MSELIWVGNYLIPRGYVIAVAVLIVILMAGAFTWLTDHPHKR